MTNSNPRNPQLVKDVRFGKKSRTVAYLLWLFLGIFSGHRFYLRKPVSAVLQILSYVLLVGIIWWVIDFFRMPRLIAESDNSLEPYPRRQSSETEAQTEISNADLKETAHVSRTQRVQRDWDTSTKEGDSMDINRLLSGDLDVAQMDLSKLDLRDFDLNDLDIEDFHKSALERLKEMRPGNSAFRALENPDTLSFMASRIVGADPDNLLLGGEWQATNRRFVTFIVGVNKNHGTISHIEFVIDGRKVDVTDENDVAERRYPNADTSDKLNVQSFEGPFDLIPHVVSGHDVQIRVIGSEGRVSQMIKDGSDEGFAFGPIEAFERNCQKAMSGSV